MSSVTEQVTEMVQEACRNESENSFGYGIWTHHIVHVVRFAKELAKQRNADPEVVELGALLHDYAAIKDSTLWKEHHIHGATEAQKILESLGVPQEKIDSVKETIVNHRGSITTEVKTKEVLILRDADAMAHFTAVPSLLYVAFKSHRMNPDEAEDWVLKKLERSWNKLSAEAKALVREKYEAAKKLLNHSNS